MAVFIANEQNLPVDETRLQSLAHHALMEEDVDPESELSILLVSSAHIKHLNARFAGNDDQGVDDKDRMDKRLRQILVVHALVVVAEEMEGPVHDEHGTLHLLGYD